MDRRGVNAGSWWLRALAIVLIGLGVFGPGLRGNVAAHEEHQDQQLDLAAMALTPEDLESVGLEGYGSDHGELFTAEQQIAEFVELGGGDPDELSEVLIDEAGLQGGYWMRIALPVDPGDFDTVATRSILVTLYAFADAEGAADGYDYLAVDAGSDEESEVDYSSVDTDITIGNASSLISFESEDRESGDPISALDLQFLSGSVIADLTMVDTLREGERADDPTVEEITALGELMVDRIDAGLDGDVPGLSGQIVRLADKDGEIETKLDIYTTVDGETIHRFNESEEDTADRQERYEDAGIVDSYAVEQAFQLGSTESMADPYYSARVFRFEDEDAAAAWLEEDAFAAISNDSSITNFEFIDDVDTLGDGTVAAAYSAEIDGESFSGRIVAVQSDELVSVTRMESGRGVTTDRAMEVAEIQLDCLNAGACEGPVAPPNGFIPA